MNTKRGLTIGEWSVKSVLGVYNTYDQHETEKVLRGVNIDIFNVYKFCLSANLMHLQVINDSRENVEAAIVKHRPDVIWMCGHGITAKGISRYVTKKNSEPITGKMAGRYVEEYTNEAKLQIYVLDFCQSGSYIDVKYKFNMSGGVWEYNEVGCDDLVVDNVDLIIAICAAPVDENSYEDGRRGGALTDFLLRLLFEYGQLSMNIIRGACLREKQRFVVTCNRQINCEAVFWKLDTEYMRE